MAAARSNTPTIYCAIHSCLLFLVMISIGVVHCVSTSTELPLNSTSYRDQANSTEHLARSIATFASSNSTRLSSRVLLLLKLLQLIQNYSSKNDSTDSSDAASESRAMSSWLRFRRPVQRHENQFIFDRNVMSNPNFLRNGPSPPPPSLFPPNHGSNNNNNFGKHHQQQDPSSLFFMPSLSDTSGIDYWLKFIEEANLEERNALPLLQGTKEKVQMHKMKPMSMSKKVKGNRYRSKPRNNVRKTTKTRFDDTLSSNGGDDSEADNLGNNDLSLIDERKSIDSQKVLKQLPEYDSSPRCDKFTDSICIDDFEYPEHAILDEIFKRKDIFQLMYSEVKGDAPLVDGLARDEEEKFSEDYYYNNNDPDSDDYDGYTSQGNRTEYNDFLDAPEQGKPEQDKKTNNKGGGFVCRSEVLYAKPKLAQNIKGKWRVIVNAGEFTQTVRLEKCTKPNSECRFIADNKYDSRCAQISAIHRLLVFEKGKGFFIDTFRVPTACTCHVHNTKDQSKYGSHYHEGSSSSLMNVKRDKSKSNGLGDTLWSLLGTEPDKNKGSNSNSDQSTNLFSGQSKGGINVELLKLLPQLTSIAPENVLQQLLEDYAQSSQPKGYGQRVSNRYQTAVKIPKSELQQLLLAHAQSSSESAKEDQNRFAETSISFPRPTTTTIVNPGGGGVGAPVVQVIHVPVSSEIMTSDVSDSMSVEGSRPVTRHRFRPINPHMITRDHSRHAPKHSKHVISSNSNYVHAPSKTNSSVAPPPLQNGTEMAAKQQPGEQQSDREKVKSEGTALAKKNNDEVKQQSGKDIKQIMDKKVNFSYHPILEYIVN